MATYVLLAFNKDEDAKTFVENALNGYVASVASEQSPYDMPSQHNAEVYGVWQKPTIFCNPSDGHRKKLTGWTRGRKYGWWVCADCGKSTERWAHGEQWDTTLGTNLLPTALRPQGAFPEYRTPSPVEWSWLLTSST